METSMSTTRSTRPSTLQSAKRSASRVRRLAAAFPSSTTDPKSKTPASPNTRRQDRASLCTFTFSDGRQCRIPRRQGHPYLCVFHAKKEAQALAGEQAGHDIASFLTGDYISACDVASALARLFSAVAQGHIKPKTAATLAYLGQTLVQTVKLAQHEYANAFGHTAWRDAIRSSFAPPPPPPRPAPPPSAAPQPRPPAPTQPPPQSPVSPPASAPNPATTKCSGESSDSSPQSPTTNAPTKQTSNNATQPTNTPNQVTPLPPTLADFAEVISRSVQSTPPTPPTDPAPSPRPTPPEPIDDPICFGVAGRNRRIRLAHYGLR